MIWVRLSDFPNYAVSCEGQMLSLRKNRIMKSHLTGGGGGYPSVCLFTNAKPTICLIHRAVAKYFVANPDNKPQVNHIDGNKSNNRYTNLEWVTAQENTIHAHRSGLTHPAFGVNHGSAKLTTSQVRRIRKLAAAKELSQTAIASMFGISQIHVSQIHRRTRRSKG